MSLAPYSRRWNKQNTSESNTKKEVAGKKSDLSELQREVQRQCERVCREDGTEACCKDRNEGKDQENQVAFPKRPILTYIVSRAYSLSDVHSQEGRWDHRLVEGQE